MSARPLQDAIVDGGIHSVNFFNGRLLTAQDLSREQDARRTADRRVAQAGGAGVAWGLEVAAASGADNPRVVTVQPGLAVSRGGHALYLQNATDVMLGQRALPRIGPTRTFENCRGLQNGGFAPELPGVYLLTLAPAEDSHGKALTHALDDAAVPCNTDTVIEAVQFRLLPLESLIEAAVRADADLLRNRVAYRCFGSEALLGFRRDPLRATAGDYGLLAGLSGETLTDCDVPLAVVSLKVGIEFVDMWSVRRPVTRRSAAGAWAMLADERREAEGRAMFLQFQEHLASLTGSRQAVPGFEARKHFERLPPVGIVPMLGEEKKDAQAIARFFAGFTVRGPVFMEGARLEPLVRSSFAFPPIESASGELVWLYHVRENRQRIDEVAAAKLAAAPPLAYLVFSSGHMPYQADARFDVSRWDYANFALE